MPVMVLKSIRPTLLIFIFFYSYQFSNRTVLTAAFSEVPLLYQNYAFLTWKRGGNYPTHHSSRIFLMDFNNQNKYSSDNDDTTTNNGMGEIAAGAILGGLLLGPLGALWGASIGANVGSSKRTEQSQRREMERMGITQDMVDMAQELSSNLQRAMEGYNASQDSLRILQSLARRLEEDVQQLQEEAKTSLVQGDDDRARTILVRKKQIMDRWKEALLTCAEENDRLDRMKQNVLALEQRAIEVDALLRRSISAKALLQDSTSTTNLNDNLSSDSFQDPLLRKFRELEGN